MPISAFMMVNDIKLCLVRSGEGRDLRGRPTDLEWRERCLKLSRWLPFSALHWAWQHAVRPKKKWSSLTPLPSTRYPASSDIQARIGTYCAFSVPCVPRSPQGLAGNAAIWRRPYFCAASQLDPLTGRRSSAFSMGCVGSVPGQPLTVRRPSCRKSSKPLLSLASFPRWRGAFCPTRSPKRLSLSSRFRPSPSAVSSDLVMGRGETLAPHTPTRKDPMMLGALC